ncbi:DNA-directed RNA polymerase subunit P [Salinarchaeum sp. IM2453]|nr:DNA-directed RNA polymerase subunit P [Salinarchaeum sp. IM2453]
MNYTCVRCKKEVIPGQYSDRLNIRCPYCGHRIWLKDTSSDVRGVAVR